MFNFMYNQLLNAVNDKLSDYHVVDF